jgi:hypothetical protein
MRKRAAVSVVLLAAACGRPVDVYPPDVVANFMATCQKRSPQPVCRCAIDALQRRVTLEQFQAFEAKIRGGELPKEIVDAVAQCRG